MRVIVEWIENCDGCLVILRWRKIGGKYWCKVVKCKFKSYRRNLCYVVILDILDNMNGWFGKL